MFCFRLNKCHDINWTTNSALFEITAFNKQVIKFDHMIRVKADRCPICLNCAMKVLKESRGCIRIAALLNKKRREWICYKDL